MENSKVVFTVTNPKNGKKEWIPILYEDFEKMTNEELVQIISDIIEKL